MIPLVSEIMENSLISLILFLGSIAAGFIGALSGQGGGAIIVPMLAIGFGVDIHYAIGASLVAVIATSTSASLTYLKAGYPNLRLGILLETSATVGAIFGVILGTSLGKQTLFFVFGMMLVYSAFLSIPKKDHNRPKKPYKWGTFFKLDGSYPSHEGTREYYVRNVSFGWMLMFVAGLFSGLLGIGSGALTVVAIDKVMQVPFRVATTTSNFMIGITAAASAGLYLNYGYIDPILVMPIVVGTLIGSSLGAPLLAKMHTPRLRIVFIILILVLAAEMLYNSLNGA